ncbi:MAG TPA: hypothetical protein VL122_00745 [Nitrospirota bacterium]|nr:hypothetical protein [Nitrospirota bacterium]
MGNRLTMLMEKINEREKNSAARSRKKKRHTTRKIFGKKVTFEALIKHEQKAQPSPLSRWPRTVTIPWASYRSLSTGRTCSQA